MLVREGVCRISGLVAPWAADLARVMAEPRDVRDGVPPRALSLQPAATATDERAGVHHTPLSLSTSACEELHYAALSSVHV